MAAKKTVIIENISRRLHVIGDIKLAPTQALAFPAEVMEMGGVKIAFDLNELKLGEETKDPITDEDAAKKELQRRSDAQAGKNTGATKTSNGAPAPKVNAGE